MTFNGQPVTAGRILFSNQRQGVYITAKIANGAYEVITSKGKGVTPGEYTVAITPPVDEHVFGPISEPPQPANYPDIPHRYRTTRNSGLAVELLNGENQADFNMEKTARRK